MKKRFDPELYRINDKLAKENTIKIVDKRKFKVVENPNTRGVDLLVYKRGIYLLNIECEIKKIWVGKKFPYDNVQFPERKEKFALLDKPTIFVMFNADQSAYLVVRDKDLLSSPKKEIPNKYVYSGEMFFQVPLDKVVFNDIKTVMKDMEEKHGK